MHSNADVAEARVILGQSNIHGHFYGGYVLGDLGGVTARIRRR